METESSRLGVDLDKSLLLGLGQGGGPALPSVRRVVLVLVRNPGAQRRQVSRAGHRAAEHEPTGRRTQSLERSSIEVTESVGEPERVRKRVQPCALPLGQ